jgi:pyruvate dehydrogenase E2 component (dihydrolipoamide acetyltransferase)
MADFVMPKLGADMSAGTLVLWYKKPGEAVRRGDIIAAVETDKGVIDVEIFSSGVLEKILVQPGEKVPVGTVLARVRGEVELISVPTPVEAPRPVVAVALSPEARAPSPVPSADLSRLRISPSARQLAQQLGIDPATVQGTGRGGTILREDIERIASARVAAPPPAAKPKPEPDRLARMRQTIAAAMSRSKREIPHYYLSTTIDLHPALSWLAEENRKRPMMDRLLYGVLLLKTAALALREVPELNAVWDGDRVVPSQAIHLGVAISLRQGGLIAPALHDADHQSLDELMRNFRDLVNRARTGGLRSSELADSTITVTSLGEQGVETVFGIIYPPQVALVGFGKVVERPWVVGGQVVPRPLVTATLSADHRVSDGHRGGLFLAAIDRLLQEPSKL